MNNPGTLLLYKETFAGSTFTCDHRLGNMAKMTELSAAQSDMNEQGSAM